MPVCFVLLVVLLEACGGRRTFHRIQVVDAATNRGIPLVELAPFNSVRYYTDSNGLIAFHEPDLMGREVFFEISSHGYEPPVLAGTDFKGAKILLAPGGGTTIRLKRINIAERLYRLTGEGIYRDTELLGEKSPIRHPLLNADVLGTDGASTVVFKGTLYWLFGDTNGLNDINLASAAATSRLPSTGGIDPAIGVDLDFFVKPSGFVKPMIETNTKGLTWPYTPMVLPDESGVERLIVRYDSGTGLGKTPLEWGIAVFNEAKNVFEPQVKWDVQAPVFPDGIAFPVTEGGVRYLFLLCGRQSHTTNARPGPVARRSGPLAVRTAAGYRS